VRRMPAGMRPQSLSVSEANGGRYKSFEVATDGELLALDGLTPGRYTIDTSQTGAGTHALIRVS